MPTYLLTDAAPEEIMLEPGCHTMVHVAMIDEGFTESRHRLVGFDECVTHYPSDGCPCGQFHVYWRDAASDITDEPRH